MAKKKTQPQPAKKQKNFMMVLWCFLLGLFLTITPTLVLLSLFGYNPEDPSFNKATTATVTNFLGTFGAYSADAVLSTFGLSLIIFMIVPIIWGIGLLRWHAFAEYKMRIFAWFVGVLSFSCFIQLTCGTYLGRFNLPYNLTGEWSRILSRPLSSYINMLNISYNTIILEGILLFISVLSFNFSAGLTFKIWMRVASVITSFFRNLGLGVFSFARKIAKIPDFKNFKELNPSYLQSKMSQNTSLRREPGFERAQTEKTPSINIIMPQTTAMAAEQKQQTQTRAGGLMIELPNTSTETYGNLAVETTGTDTPTATQTKKSSYNPTFDFVNEGDIANQNVKKPSKKISPEEIYQTEGVKNFTDKSAKTRQAQPKPQQEELLTIKKNSQVSASLEPQTQMPASAELPAAKPTPATAPVQIEEKTHEYHLPDINLLSVPKESGAVTYDEAMLTENAARLEEVLKDFGIRGKIVKVRPGPVVTLYELEPAPGTRTARVIGLSDDIARSMAVASVRMAVVSGRNTIGIELPNEKRETVWLRELLEDNEFKTNKNILNVTLGKDIGGQHIYADLSKMPHLLVAGTTGSGKSVGVNSMILSLLYRMTPEQCKFIMIDPKQLEFSMYNGIPHLLTPVITDPAKAVVGLKWAVREMEDRYRAMAQLNVRNIAGYNQKVADMRASGKEIKKTIQTGFDKETGRPIYEEQTLDTTPMPYIVIVVDEMADLMLVAGKEVEAAIQRLAQMARAAGIHLIMSTQRPSVDVITGTIKSNFPSRISFHVTTKIDSRTILGEQGAEQLLGMGDMLYMPSGLRPIRVHGCFVTDAEVEKIVEFIKSQGEPKYVADVTEGELNSKDSGPVFDKGEMAGGNDDDDLYNQAVAIVRADKKASTSYIQRKLRIGYNRAAILIERMEDEGVVTPPDRVGRREIIGAE